MTGFIVGFILFAVIVNIVFWVFVVRGGRF